MRFLVRWIGRGFLLVFRLGILLGIVLLLRLFRKRRCFGGGLVGVLGRGRRIFLGLGFFGTWRGRIFFVLGLLRGFLLLSQVLLFFLLF